MKFQKNSLSMRQKSSLSTRLRSSLSTRLKNSLSMRLRSSLLPMSSWSLNRISMFQKNIEKSVLFLSLFKTNNHKNRLQPRNQRLKERFRLIWARSLLNGASPKKRRDKSRKFNQGRWKSYQLRTSVIVIKKLLLKGRVDQGWLLLNLMKMKIKSMKFRKKCLKNLLLRKFLVILQRSVKLPSLI